MAFIGAITIAGFTIAATTVTSIVVAVVTAAISMGLSMLLAPSGNGSPPKDEGVRQRLPTDPKNKLGIIYGNRKMSGQITFADISHDNQHMYFIICLAEGPCDKVTDVFWADRKLSFSGDINSGLRNVTNSVSDNGEGESSDFLNDGRCKMQVFPAGGRCGPMESNSSRWRNDSDKRSMPDTCYVFVQLRYSREKRVSGLESKLFFYVDGKKVRTFNNSGDLSSTSSLSFSKNPSECLVDYLTNKIYGCNIPDQDLDLPSFYRHSKFCGETLTHKLSDGTNSTGARYELNGTLSTNSELDMNISEITTNSGAWFTYTLGKFGIISDSSVRKLASDTVTSGNNKDGIASGVEYVISDIGSDSTNNKSFTDFGASSTPEVGEIFLATKSSGTTDSSTTVNSSTFTGKADEIAALFSEDNMYSSINLTSGGFENIVNRLTIKYPGKDQGQQEEDQLIIDTRESTNAFYINPTNSSFINEDEPLLEKTLNMQLTRSNIQAQRIGAININNSRQNIVVEFSTDLKYSYMEAGDVIAIRHTTPGWGYEGNNFDLQNPVEDTPKLFRIVSIEEEVKENNLHLKISAQEYADGNYEDLVIQERDTAPNTQFPSPSREPDIGSTTVRSKKQEYSFASTTQSSLALTVTSGTNTRVNNLTINKFYSISSLGNTTQATFNLLADTSGVTYSVGSTFTADLENVSVTSNATAIVASTIYTIATLGTTTQSIWNTLAGTSGANYVVGSSFTASVNGGVGSGTGTVTSDAGTGTVNERVITTITLGSDKTASGVATSVASGISSNSLVTSSVVDSRIKDTVLITFNGSTAGDGVISGASTTAGDVEIRFDNATLSATDSGVSKVVNGIPTSGLSVSYRDDDPFLDRVEIRWFNSSNSSISMDPADGTNYIGDDIFQVNGRGVLGKYLIGNALTTNNSPFEILDLNPESTYQIDVRGYSYLGTKSDFQRLSAVNTDSLASLYTASLTSPNISVPSVSGNAGTFSVGGEYQVFAGNTRVVNNIYYRLFSSSNIPSGNATIASDGTYEVTQFSSTTNEQSAEAVFRATVVDTTDLAINDGSVISSGTNYSITSLGTTTTANWVSAGFPSGVTPVVGYSFMATGSSLGTGKVAKTLIELDRTYKVIKVVDTKSLIRLEIAHEIESTPGSNVYVAAPNFFRDNLEYSGSSNSHTTSQVLSGHNYTIATIGSGTVALAQARWNEIAGTTGSRNVTNNPFTVNEVLFAKINGGDATGNTPTTDGTATTTERNYRLSALVYKGVSLDSGASSYNYHWYKDGVSKLNGVGLSTIEVNAADIGTDSESYYKVILNTDP